MILMKKRLLMATIVPLWLFLAVELYAGASARYATGGSGSARPRYCQPSTEGGMECHEDEKPRGKYNSLYNAEKAVAGFFEKDTRRVKGECKTNTEADYVIFKKTTKGNVSYYVGGKSWFAGVNEQGDSYGYSTAPAIDLGYVKKMRERGYEPVEDMHNHHDRLHRWPTVSDALSVIVNERPIVVYGCDGKMLRIENSGVVTEIDLASGSQRTVTYEEYLQSVRGRFVIRQEQYQGLMSLEDFEASSLRKNLYDGRNPSFEQMGELVQFWRNPSAIQNEGNEINAVSRLDVSTTDFHQNDDVVDRQKADKSDSQVGVCGWCHCGHSNTHVVGDPTIAPYTYSLCLKCGKVEKGPDGYRGLMIVDNRHSKGADREMAMASQAKLFAIPDGQVVIPGKCTCPGSKKASDFVRAGGLMVHIDCGRVMMK